MHYKCRKQRVYRRPRETVNTTTTKRSDPVRENDIEQVGPADTFQGRRRRPRLAPGEKAARRYGNRFVRVLAGSAEACNSLSRAVTCAVRAVFRAVCAASVRRRKPVAAAFLCRFPMPSGQARAAEACRATRPRSGGGLIDACPRAPCSAARKAPRGWHESPQRFVFLDV